MAVTTHRAYTAAAATILTTQLNSLANNTNTAASSTVDNTTNLDLYVDLELVLAAQGSARSTGAYVTVYIVRSLDGTNFDDVNETTAAVAAVFTLDAATTARRMTVVDIPIPPGLFKFFVRNSTGQAFAASGNTLSHRYHSIQNI